MVCLQALITGCPDCSFLSTSSPSNHRIRCTRSVHVYVCYCTCCRLRLAWKIQTGIQSRPEALWHGGLRGFLSHKAGGGACPAEQGEVWHFTGGLRWTFSWRPAIGRISSKKPSTQHPQVSVIWFLPSGDAPKCVFSHGTSPVYSKLNAAGSGRHAAPRWRVSRWDASGILGDPSYPWGSMRLS